MVSAHLVGVVLATLTFAAPSGERHALRWAPAPPDNPLKGLVPYAGARDDPFPHSMEFNYLPLGALATGPSTFDWSPLERLLDEVAGRGHHAVFRIYLEYPGKSDGIPRFLLDEGLKVHRYQNTNTQPFPPREVATPDYEDPRLRRLLRGFIAALGERYDGDPRIGAITAGLLGTWGEWHTYPRDDLFASKEVQREVMDAYAAAFAETPVLLRYPAGPDDQRYAANDDRPFGYHDDSFAWATLETGRAADSWFFMALLRAAGPGALVRWKSQPIGGEIRPELWGKVFDPDPGVPEAQNFVACVEATHASWLMDTGMFRGPIPPDRRERAIDAVRRLGYEFHVPAVTLPDRAEGRALPVTVELVNRGVAPFYRNWRLEYALLAEDGAIARRSAASGELTGLLPGDPPRRWSDRMDLAEVPAGRYRVLLRVVTPLPGGLPLRFANAEQDRDLPGWLTLGEVEVAAGR